jgi:hypothetical protein
VERCLSAQFPPKFLFCAEKLINRTDIRQSEILDILDISINPNIKEYVIQALVMRRPWVRIPPSAPVNIRLLGNIPEAFLVSFRPVSAQNKKPGNPGLF